MARDKSAQLLSSHQAALQLGDMENSSSSGQSADGATGHTLRTLWCRAERPPHRKESTCPPSSKTFIPTMNRRSSVGPMICRHSHLHPGLSASIHESPPSVQGSRGGRTSNSTTWQHGASKPNSFRCFRSELAFRAEPSRSEPNSGPQRSRRRRQRGTRWARGSRDGPPSAPESDCASGSPVVRQHSDEPTPSAPLDRTASPACAETRNRIPCSGYLGVRRTTGPADLQ